MLMEIYSSIISRQLSLPPGKVANVLKLFDEGATVPFIARYRKEMTGSMDEETIIAIDEKYAMLKDLIKRKEFILKSIEEQGKLTEELRRQIENTFDPVLLEDLYLPFKRSNKTRAAKAREKGLQPLADFIISQKEGNVYAFARKFTGEKVPGVEDAIQGAKDIVAEYISENKEVRQLVRDSFDRYSFLQAKVIKTKEAEAQKYKDYFDYIERLNRIPSHRLLAVFRAEKEKLLRVKFVLDDDIVLSKIRRIVIKKHSPVFNILRETVEDSYKRLIAPAIETEMRTKYKEKADLVAIEVFAANLRNLLMAPPLGQKRILAIDPGFRTGCKVVCLDQNGDLVADTVIYPHPPLNKDSEAASILKTCIEKYKIEAIAVGNGTAGRETLAWLKGLNLDKDIDIFLVNEDGASIYSASPVAREEFPDKDITVRGAVSIGRRLMDPLAELVKIEPKSIGVGQYQYDVNQKLLKEKLDRVVISVVNTVGINLNTASVHLLSYVSGIGPVLAKNIVKYRSQIKKFSDRMQLKDVPRLGDKAFELAAGFLRIKDGSNPLDNTAVHPMHYDIVKKMADDLNVSITELAGNSAMVDMIDPERYITQTTGLPTLQDILQELKKPGLDPRGKAGTFDFNENIKTIEDIKPGMYVNGIVTNVTNFGAFVDIGIKENALIHISQLSNQYISDPKQIIKVNQQVKAKVLNVDLQSKRIQLSLKE